MYIYICIYLNANKLRVKFESFYIYIFDVILIKLHSLLFDFRVNLYVYIYAYIFLLIKNCIKRVAQRKKRRKLIEPRL